MGEPRRWKRLGWEGPLLLVGALATGLAVAAGSCDGNDSKSGAVGKVPTGTGSIPCIGGGGGSIGSGGSGAVDDVVAAAAESVVNGRKTFRFDTFGDEAFWGDTLKLHQAIAGSANGGVGDGVSPKTALAVGLKVDAEAVPADVAAGIKAGTVNLDDPKTTLALLKLNAVVGVTGFFASDGSLRSMGIQCALCHSTVDDSFAPGIGKRLDGWPNRDLDPGRIIALSRVLDPATKAVYNSWGPGKYDPRFNIDGLSKPLVIPPAFGLAGAHFITVTGDGTEIAYWNRYVAVTQMGGLGSFSEPRLNLSITNGSVDLVSSKLPALQAYQLSLSAPAAPAGSFDTAAAARGKLVFDGKGQCATCHSGSLFTDASGPNPVLHPPADSMAEPEAPSYASRSATKMYRTSPLKGVWQHAPYFHDGSAATLEDVGRIYNTKRLFGVLSEQEIADLAQYLRSL
jgi:mono/diheme cytochrome c family protein